MIAPQRQPQFEKKAAHFRFRQIGERRFRIRPMPFASPRDDYFVEQFSFHDCTEAIDRFTAAMEKPAAQIQLPAKIALLNWSVETEDVLFRRGRVGHRSLVHEKARVRLQSMVSPAVAGTPG